MGKKGLKKSSYLLMYGPHCWIKLILSQSFKNDEHLTGVSCEITVFDVFSLKAIISTSNIGNDLKISADKDITWNNLRY